MKASPPRALLQKARAVFHQQSGPLTEELVLRPGDFGLGQAPARLKPDATATTVCGLCSTGCGEMFSRWTSPEAVFQILKALSRGQPCDFTGIRDFAHLDACGGIQCSNSHYGPVTPRRVRAPGL